MNRRKLMLGIGTAAIAPLVARAQQTPVLGFLSSRSRIDSEDVLGAFQHGLRETGFVENRDVTIEYRWADGRYDHLPALAAELVAHGPVLLVAVGGEPAAVAAKSATSTVPIVFSIGSDPVRLGLVDTFNHPGGNATGVSILTTQLEAKRFGVLHDLVPRATVVAVLLDAGNPPAERQLGEVQEAAGSVGCRVEPLRAQTEAELDAAFVLLPRTGAQALLVTASPFFDAHRERIVGLAAKSRLPTMYQFRSYVIAGGLISYGTDLTDGYRQVGRYAGRILKGARPAELPVIESAKFTLVINLKTAKALGLNLPQLLLAQADEVIE